MTPEALPRCSLTLRLLALTAAALLGGCTPTARTVRPTEALRPGYGVVMGRVGARTYANEAPLGQKLILERISDRKQWQVEFTDVSISSGAMVPFFVDLPAGRYAVERFELEFLGPTLLAHHLAEFDVMPGRVVCLGDLYGAGLPTKRGTRNVTLGNTDSCVELTKALVQRAPALKALFAEEEHERGRP
jgi:hypothetical protein